MGVENNGGDNAQLPVQNSFLMPHRRHGLTTASFSLPSQESRMAEEKMAPVETISAEALGIEPEIANFAGHTQDKGKGPPTDIPLIWSSKQPPITTDDLHGISDQTPEEFGGEGDEQIESTDMVRREPPKDEEPPGWVMRKFF